MTRFSKSTALPDRIVAPFQFRQNSSHEAVGQQACVGISRPAMSAVHVAWTQCAAIWIAQAPGRNARSPQENGRRFRCPAWDGPRSGRAMAHAWSVTTDARSPSPYLMARRTFPRVSAIASSKSRNALCSLKFQPAVTLVEEIVPRYAIMLRSPLAARSGSGTIPGKCTPV